MIVNNVKLYAVVKKYDMAPMTKFIKKTQS